MATKKRPQGAISVPEVVLPNTPPVSKKGGVNGSGKKPEVPKAQPTLLERLLKEGKDLVARLRRLEADAKVSEEAVARLDPKSKSKAAKDARAAHAAALAAVDQAKAAVEAKRAECKAAREADPKYQARKEAAQARAKERDAERQARREALRSWKPLEKPAAGKAVRALAARTPLAACVQGLGGSCYEVLERTGDRKCYVVRWSGHGDACKTCKASGYKEVYLLHPESEPFADWIDALQVVTWLVQDELAAAVKGAKEAEAAKDGAKK